MSIDLNLMATDVEGINVSVFSHTFETTVEAADWWNKFSKMTTLQGDDVRDVIVGTRDVYVGTEHELKNADGEYTHLTLMIEGRETKKYEKRFGDLYVDEIIEMGDGQFQLNGKDVDGKATWMTVHLVDKTTFRQSSVGVDPES